MLYGEKFRFDIITVSYLALYMISMTLINYYALPQQYTLIMYLVIILYCKMRFAYGIKPILVNVVFSIVIIGGVQMLAMLPISDLLGIRWNTDLQLLDVD